MTHPNKQKGFTLFIAIVITATLLLVSTGIATIALKEAFLTSSARESQHAFYAADTGIECALFWDLRNTTGESAFERDEEDLINCNGQVFSVGGASVSTFSLTLDPDPYCSIVTVTKSNSAPKTVIQSLGYNTCDPGNPRRVERAVRVSY